MGDSEKADIPDELRHGPVQQRSCTDVICCLMFVAFLAFVVFVNVQSFAKSDVTKVARPYDVDGKEKHNLRKGLWAQ